MDNTKALLSMKSLSLYKLVETQKELITEQIINAALFFFFHEIGFFEDQFILSPTGQGCSQA